MTEKRVCGVTIQQGLDENELDKVKNSRKILKIMYFTTKNVKCWKIVVMSNES